MYPIAFQPETIQPNSTQPDSKDLVSHLLRQIHLRIALLSLALLSLLTALPASADLDAQWDRLLARHVIERPGQVTLFDYASAQRQSKAEVEAYVAALSAQGAAGLSRNAALAYWINLYNAATVQVILEHYPVSSIRRIGGSALRPGPWNDAFLSVQGRGALSLNDIEHRILRAEFNEPRIHFAINCASIGCPDLKPQAWRAASLENDLNRAAVYFINHPRGVWIENGNLKVSSIFHWFKEDFGTRDAAVIAYLRRFARPELAAQLADYDRISGHAYDWGLNAP